MVIPLMRIDWLLVLIVLVMAGGVAEARTPAPRPKPTKIPEAIRPTTDNAPSLDKRVQRLEKDVSNLKQMLEDLDAQIATIRSQLTVLDKELHPKYPIYRIGQDKEEIRRTLREGMTQDEVRKLIGDPDRIDRYGLPGMVWYYGFSHVDFGLNGTVVGWFGF